VKDTKQIILATANHLIEKKGVKNTSLRDVAAECKMSLGTITYHFPSKERLLFAVMTQRLDERDLHLAKCFSLPTKEARVHALTEYFRSIKYSIQYQELYNYLMFSALSSDSILRDDITNLFTRWKNTYAGFLPTQVTEQARKDYASFLQLFINGTALCSSYYKDDFPYESMVRCLVDIEEQFRNHKD